MDRIDIGHYLQENVGAIFIGVWPRRGAFGSQFQPEADQPMAGAMCIGCFVYRVMYNVYVLKSLQNGKRYVGFTGNDVMERLREHNNGTNKWTRANGPFKIV